MNELKQSTGLTRVIVPVERLYAAINSAETLYAQQLAKAVMEKEVKDQLDYDNMHASCKTLSAASKSLEAVAKEVTQPLKDYAAQVAKTAKETYTPFEDAISEGKRKMLAWSRQQEEAAIKAKSEAIMNAPVATDLAGQMDMIQNRLFATPTPRTKNVRTIKKVAVIDETLINWSSVMGILIESGAVDRDDLLQKLIKACNSLQIEFSFAGLEIQTEKTQAL
jgi:hypothetical protein